MSKSEIKKQEKFDESKIRHPFFETSSFEVQFPKHRIAYIKSIEDFAIRGCQARKVKLEVDYERCILKVSTTKETRDPYIIIKANELIQLLGKGVTLEHAIKILEDGVASEILPVKAICSSEKVFERRKHRLENPKIKKSIELITKSHIQISNKTVCIVGEYRGVYEAKDIIIKCFENIHPAFELKKLIIKKKLIKEGREGDWDRLLPKIKKTHSKKKGESRKTGNLPEEIPNRKEDIEIETGEFFSKTENIEKMREKEERRKRREEERKAKREKHLVPDE